MRGEGGDDQFLPVFAKHKWGGGPPDPEGLVVEGVPRQRRLQRRPLHHRLRRRSPSPFVAARKTGGTFDMIIAIGSDLCNIERIQASLDRFGTRFEQRVFTEVERAKASKRPFTRAGTFAKRFAAKEAFSKAVGTGFSKGVFMKDIGVVNKRGGAPTLALTGGAAARLAAITPPG